MATSDDVDPATTTRSTLGLLLGALDRPTKLRLGIAAVVSGVLALLETVAIVTVLPLVSLATGAPLDAGVIGEIWRILGHPSRAQLGVVLVAMVVLLFILKDVLAVAFSWWQTGFTTSRRIALSTEIFRGIMRESFVSFRHRSVAESLRVMNAAVGQMFGAVNALVTLISTGLTVLAILIALLATTPVQAILALLYFSLAALAYLRLVRPRIQRVGDDLMEGSKEATIAGLQGLQGFKEVKLRGTAEFFVDRFARGLRQSEFAAREGNFFSSITRYLLEILFILGVGGLLLTSFLTQSAVTAIGSLALFVAAGFRLLPNISSLVGAVNAFRVGRASIVLVSDELARSRETAALTQPEAADLDFTASIVLDRVRFGYPGAQDDVLRGIDLEIPFGGSIAFVGASGAGKTTAVDVILGLLRPSAGRVLVDGEDITGREAAWQRHCAMVSQDVFIAEDTVRKNVLFDVPVEDADEDQLQDAIAKAQLQDVVDALPGGLDGDVGDWGARLSGGQRQRLGIARALYRRPRLLVLDEATSALDNETERRITTTIDALKGECTVIVVAHRLSTVRNVDRVVFLEDGAVAGIGSFDELRRSSPGFAHLVELGDLGSGHGDGDR